MKKTTICAAAIMAPLTLFFARDSLSDAEIAVSRAQPKMAAVAVLHPTQTHPAFGKISIRNAGDGVIVRVELGGLDANSEYSLKVHAYGDCAASDFRSAGAVFGNPGGLIRFESGADGWTDLLFSDREVRLGRSRDSILGRSVVVHHGEMRVGCGTIGVAKLPETARAM